VTSWKRAALLAVAPPLGLVAFAPAVQSEEVVAQVDIRRVAVNDDAVLRIRAIYFCPDG
jgi:hypothetical protein